MTYREQQDAQILQSTLRTNGHLIEVIERQTRALIEMRAALTASNESATYFREKSGDISKLPEIADEAKKKNESDLKRIAQVIS